MGFIDTTGKEVIAAIYDENATFSEGVAFVAHDGKQFLVDKTGAVIREVDYVSVGEFFDGIALATRGDHHSMQGFYIDREGNEFF